MSNVSITEWLVVRHPLYRKLQRENESLRRAATLVASARGSDYRPGANCDSEIIRKFAELEHDYKALEKLLADERMERMLIKRRLRELLQELAR